MPCMQALYAKRYSHLLQAYKDGTFGTLYLEFEEIFT